MACTLLQLLGQPNKQGKPGWEVEREVEEEEKRGGKKEGRYI